MFTQQIKVTETSVSVLFREDYKVSYEKRKGDVKMILFMILLTTLIILIALTVLVISVGGALGIVLFGDVIICIILLAWVIGRLMKRATRRRRK